MAVINDGDVDYDYKVGTCDRCGKQIVFSYFQPYECYTYKMERQEKGRRIKSIYCGWNCYCAAKKEYCIKNINKGRGKYSYYDTTPCEEWLDSVIPKARDDNRTVMERLGLEVKAEERPLRGMAKQRSKFDMIVPYFEKIKELREKQISWAKIPELLDLDIGCNCIRVNFLKLEEMERQGGAV